MALAGSRLYVRSLLMAAMTEPDQEARDLMPPPGWTPKSRYLRYWWARAEYERTHMKVAVPCPKCGEPIPLVLTTQDETPDFVIRDDPPKD